MINDKVKKIDGYRFEGYVVSVFTKHNSVEVRVVVENQDGILHIFNPKQLKKAL